MDRSGALSYSNQIVILFSKFCYIPLELKFAWRDMINCLIEVLCCNSFSATVLVIHIQLYNKSSYRIDGLNTKEERGVHHDKKFARSVTDGNLLARKSIATLNFTPKPDFIQSESDKFTKIVSSSSSNSDPKSSAPGASDCRVCHDDLLICFLNLAPTPYLRWQPLAAQFLRHTF